MKKGSLQLGSPEIIAVRGLDAKVQAWAGEGASIEHVDFLMEGVSCRLPCGPLWREPSEGSGYDALALGHDPTASSRARASRKGKGQPVEWLA
jgi:hypothetical protein